MAYKAKTDSAATDPKLKDQPKPAAETPKEETPKEQKPAPTPEELEAQTEDFLHAQFGIGRAKKEPEAKPQPEPKSDKPADDPPNEESPKPEDEPPKDEKPKRRYTPKPTAKEVEEIARRVVQEAAPAPEPAKPADAEPSEKEIENLTDQDRDTLDVIAEMEKNNPAKYGGLRKSALKFWKAEQDRKKKWETDNPGVPYAPEDPDHAEFYKKNEPKYSPRDFTEANRSLIATQAATKAREELRKEYEPRLQQMEAEEARKKAEPEIAETVMDAVEEVFRSAPEFEKLIEPKKLTGEAVQKMAEINPVIHHHAVEEAELVMGLVSELERLARPGLRYGFDPAKAQQLESGRVVYPHAMINEAWQSLESRLAQAPKEELVDDGRTFISSADFNARSEQITRSNLSAQEKNRRLKELRDNTWTVAPAHVRKFLISQSTSRIKKVAEKFKHFTKTPEKAALDKNGKPAGTAEPPKPPAKPAAPKGTSTASASDMADNSGAIGGGVEDSSKEFLRAHSGI